MPPPGFGQFLWTLPKPDPLINSGLDTSKRQDSITTTLLKRRSLFEALQQTVGRPATNRYGHVDNIFHGEHKPVNRGLASNLTVPRVNDCSYRTQTIKPKYYSPVSKSIHEMIYGLVIPLIYKYTG